MHGIILKEIYLPLLTTFESKFLFKTIYYIKKITKTCLSLYYKI